MCILPAPAFIHLLILCVCVFAENDMYAVIWNEVDDGSSDHDGFRKQLTFNSYHKTS